MKLWNTHLLYSGDGIALHLLTYCCNQEGKWRNSCRLFTTIRVTSRSSTVTDFFSFELNHKHSFLANLSQRHLQLIKGQEMLCAKKNKIKRRGTLIAFVNWSSHQVRCRNTNGSSSRWRNIQTITCSSCKSSSCLQPSLRGTDGWGSAKFPHHWDKCENVSAVRLEEEGKGYLPTTRCYILHR